MPFIFSIKKEHQCYMPTGKNHGLGALWQCGICRGIYKLVRRGEIPNTANWQEIGEEEANRLIKEHADKIRAAAKADDQMGTR